MQRTIAAHLRSGSVAQDQQIRELQGRAIMLSLKVVELVDATVASKSLSLATAAGEPYLENSCCDDPPTNPLAYFIKAQPPIAEKNREAGRVRDFLDDLGLMARAPMLFDARDTRRVFPPPATEFSEDTIYRAFIVFCKYDSEASINPRLERVCAERPDSYDVGASIEEKIEALKSAGLVRNQRSLHQLMQVVDEDNLVRLDLGVIALSTTQSILATLRDPDLVFPAQLTPRLEAALEAGSGPKAAEGAPSPARAFREFLAEGTGRAVESVQAFLGRASGSKRRAIQAARECVQSLTGPRSAHHGSQPVRYLKDYMHLIVRVFPNIVLNGVNYASVSVPAHWKLSQSHDNQVKSLVERYYAPLTPFYGDVGLRSLLGRFVADGTGVDTLLHRLYPEAGDSPLDERTTGLVGAYLLASGLASYVELSTREPEIAREAAAARNAASAATGSGAGAADVALGDPLGAQEVLATRAADLLVAVLGIVCNEQRLTEISYDELMRLVHRSAEHEKDLHVAALGALTDEEREAEMQLRRLDLRARGTGGGAYKAATYDQEVSQMEAQALAEMRVGEEHMVTAMNRDIYAMDAIAEQAEADRIEAEEADLGHLADDDDHGDRDGDEGY